MEIEKSKLEVKLHKNAADKLNDTVNSVNNDLNGDYIPFNDSTIVEALIQVWKDDADKEHVGTVINKIENIREESNGTEIVSKTFRICKDEYEDLIRLKQSMNKYNKYHDTIKISEVLEYLIWNYSLEVELQLID